MTQANLTKLPQPNKDKPISQSESSTPRRRVWTGKQKLQVLLEVDQLKKNGADVGSYIRRKGLYSSTISLWRKQRNEGNLGVTEKKRGPKGKITHEMIENQRLQMELDRVNKKLAQAEKLLELQKKIAEMFPRERE